MDDTKTKPMPRHVYLIAVKNKGGGGNSLMVLATKHSISVAAPAAVKQDRK